MAAKLKKNGENTEFLYLRVINPVLMNKRNLFLSTLIIVALVIAACISIFGMKEKNESSVNIGRSEIRISDGHLTPEVLWGMGRVGGVSVSPDGSRVEYQVT